MSGPDFGRAQAVSISISSDTLFAYYQARAGVVTTDTSAATSLAAGAPIAPWSSAATANATSSSASATAASTNSLVASLLEGNSIVNPGATKLSATTSSAVANSDYKNLFALYSGLSSLETLATAASGSGISTAQLDQYESAFSTGLAQVRDFLGSTPFQEFAVSNGKIETQAESTTGAAQGADSYDTQALVTGSSTTPVPAFEGGRGLLADRHQPAWPGHGG